MKNTRLLNSFIRFAVLLGIIVTIGTTNLISAQTSSPFPLPFYAKMDFTGDQRVDIVFANPSSNDWLIQSLDGTVSHASIGTIGDRPVAGDYDGDHIEDVAVVSSKGKQLVWHIQRSTVGDLIDVRWGMDGDTLVQADYDGDGLTDPAVWRSSEGMWFILSSMTGEAMMLSLGTSTDKAMPGDYNGDGMTDVCVFNPTRNTFLYYTSSSDILNEVVFGPFAMTGYETFVPADYDGDTKTDFAMFDPAKGRMFVVLESSTGKYRMTSLKGGSPLCIPYAPEPCSVFDFAVPADYDYDGRVDPAIWDSKNSTVIAFGSRRGPMEFPTQASGEMIPVSSFYMSK